MKTITFIESSKRILSIFCIIYLAYETLWLPTEILEGVFDNLGFVPIEIKMKIYLENEVGFMQQLEELPKFIQTPSQFKYVINNKMLLNNNK